MTDLVPPDEIESIVGITRHPTIHYGRAVPSEQMVYILHSQECRNSGIDLRECQYSVALDYGIKPSEWEGREDRPVILMVSKGRLLGGD